MITLESTRCIVWNFYNLIQEKEMLNLILILIGLGTFSVALFTFLSIITDCFKRKIPLEFGFLLDNATTTQLNLSSGDPAKPIFLRFHNTSKTTLTGIVLDIRVMRPLSISGTDHALTYIPGKTIHGKPPGNAFYHIRYSELVLFGNDKLDIKIELNTTRLTPGTYKIESTAYSSEQDFKYKKIELIIKVT